MNGVDEGDWTEEEWGEYEKWEDDADFSGAVDEIEYEDPFGVFAVDIIEENIFTSTSLSPRTSLSMFEFVCHIL